MPQTDEAAPRYPLESPPQYTEQGYLQARVYAARQAIPIKNATVTVSRREEDGGETLLFAGQTDAGGLSPIFTLPAPPRALSEEPGAFQPYARYILRVSASEYASAVLDPVYVFSGITSVQPAELIPLKAAEVK